MILHRGNLDPAGFPQTRKKLVISGSLLIVGGFLPIVCVLGLFLGVIPFVGWVIAGLSGILLFFGWIVMIACRIVSVIWAIMNYMANSKNENGTAATTNNDSQMAQPVSTNNPEVVAVPAQAVITSPEQPSYQTAEPTTYPTAV